MFKLLKKGRTVDRGETPKNILKTRKNNKRKDVYYEFEKQKNL